MHRTGPPRRLWLVACFTIAVAVAVLAIAFLESWAVALLVGCVTIGAVAIDSWLISRSRIDDQVAVDPTPTPARFTVDLRRRR